MTSTPKTVLLIEDNENIMNANRRALEAAGYRTKMAADLGAARSCLARSRPDAIVLDILLPDGNGLDFIGKIREITDAPVLLLTALGEKEDMIRGLRAGGDDYITKPYDLDELVARVEAFIRRREMYGRSYYERIKRGPLTLHMVAQQAFLDGEDLLLAPKEFALLLTLLEHEDQYVDAETLYRSVWKTPMAEDGNALWKQMSRLKRKLESRRSQIYLSVSRGKGYKLEFDDSYMEKSTPT